MGLLPFLSWPHWHWLHARLVYFDVLLGRETSVASWRKTIILSVHFYLLCQSRDVTEKWLPQLFGERLMKARTEKQNSTTNTDVISALDSFDTADGIMMLLINHIMMNHVITTSPPPCYSPSQWLTWGKRPLNAGFSHMVFCLWKVSEELLEGLEVSAFRGPEQAFHLSNWSSPNS